MSRRAPSSRLLWVLVAGYLSSLATALTYNSRHQIGRAFAAHRSDNAIVTWGLAGFGDVGVVPHVASIASTNGAFAAIMEDGSLNCWGSALYGGDCSSITSTTIQNIYPVSKHMSSTTGAFAAIDSDGKVYAWGSALSGSDFSYVAELLLDGVVSIDTCGVGFVAIKEENVLVPWASTTVGDPEVWSVVDAQLGGGTVKRIYGNEAAFCLLMTDGSVYCWGDSSYGGNGPISPLTNIDDIFVTDSAFAALDTSGNVYTWGDVTSGGDSSSVILINVATISSTGTAFAALKNDGTVVTWGNAAYGGDSSSVAPLLTQVLKIYSSYEGFVALTVSGTVIGWGTDATPPAISDPVIDISAGLYAFSALTTTGIVSVWGNPSYTAVSGLSSAILSSGSIRKVFANNFAFAAIYGAAKEVVCWGFSATGGDCTAMATQLFDISYIYGSEWLQEADFQNPTRSPTSSPSAAPVTNKPTSQPIRPTARPTASMKPTKTPQVNPFNTHDPTSSPSAKPTFSTTPVIISRATNNMTYYCRPRHYINSANGM
jgi:alpha-tubulin suppressor-like RCC1 family protein